MERSSKKILLIVTAMGSFLAPFMGSAIVVALPVLGAEFSMSAVSLTWVAMSYLLSAAVFLLPAGRLSDIFGRKHMFAGGIALFGASSLLSAFSNSVSLLLVSRFIQGISGAMIFSSPMAMLMTAFKPDERGKAIGINVASVYIGLSAGPFVGGIFTGQFGWRSIFILQSALAFITLVPAVFMLEKETPAASGEKFDWKGSLVYCAVLAALMFGVTHLTLSYGAALAVAGFLGLFVFWQIEERVEFPVFNARLFMQNRVFAFSNLAALINYSATAAVGFILSLYLQYIKGFSPQVSGLLLVVQPVIQAVFSPFAGRLSDKKEPQLIASFGMALTAAGLFILIFLDNSTPLWLIVFCLALMGFGFALFSSPNTNAVMSSVDRKFYGVASGILGTMRLTGQMMSMAVATLVFSIVIGGLRITPESHHLFLKSSRIVITVLAAMCVSGIFASLARGKVR
ncbi:MAG TPA: MFS transporter [Elusimicrobia bacterium]|nr:MAG: MFS transporter [Elusimicrobia bacterium RIFOXYA12_FULL_49_49]OGS06243.1 MAG: MFS transporter [Elusimicrobia bacterium RIFOXYA1_FULL_47_7]OGS10232.1 MAG: MFS transporter [Elusimicrobia bacterium RIFOXYB1_FULL_48_9]OGS14646.1 MAG: MFS transporter [Elusimicrobia bacterium RIFOXYA2_FULL_47_53]OGS25701.1 MAG: MFS transporter [Elusimicrobia bacterium RIFOXYB12_FULL_50_12]OGS31737.1 MAG: MFS transporter [Elusimicrobia bacterium RIFOXYB2_FULL_46_23]HBU69735.1 MFS transporter [Elusimicrobiota